MAPKPLERIYHTWDKWECYPSGFYEDLVPGGMTQEEGEVAYQRFLSDSARFGSALEGLTREWSCSCEHYLTNERMNRIAWLGQAAAAYAERLPSCCRGGFNRLLPAQQEEANLLALQYLNRWLECHGYEAGLTLESAQSRTEADLY